MLKIAPHIVLFIIIPVISFVSTDAFSESISLNDTASSSENLNATAFPIINGTADQLKQTRDVGCGFGILPLSGANINFGNWNQTDITGTERTGLKNKGAINAMLSVFATPWYDDEGNNIMPANATSFTVTDKKTLQILVPPTLLSTNIMNLTTIVKTELLWFDQTVTVAPFENATGFSGNVTQILSFRNLCLP